MRIVVFDLETGGVEPHHPDIQIAAVVVDSHWNEIDHYQAKILFDEAKAHPDALAINHYDREVWRAEGVRPVIAVKEFGDFLRQYSDVPKVSKAGRPYRVAKLAGYNCETFDAPRLQRLFKAHDAFLPAGYDTLDVLQLVRWYFHVRGGAPENMKLSTVCESLGIPLPGAHDALADVRGTAAVARFLIPRLTGAI